MADLHRSREETLLARGRVVKRHDALSSRLLDTSLHLVTHLVRFPGIAIIRAEGSEKQREILCGRRSSLTSVPGRNNFPKYEVYVPGIGRLNLFDTFVACVCVRF